MPKFDIKLEGSQEFFKFLDDLQNKEFSDQVLGDMAQKAASVVRSEARRSMPVDGELGRVGKKAVVIKKDKQNKTIRAVTIGSGYVSLDGKQVSVGKIIRHMTAGRQNLRKRKGNLSTGKVQQRGGDFIAAAFERKKGMAIKSYEDSFVKILKKRAARSLGITYAS